MTGKLAQAARLLRGAYAGQTVEPLRAFLDAGDADGAYAVQKINTDCWVEQGRGIVGRKIGLTAAAVQAQLGVAQPDFGVLFDDMRIKDGGVLPADRLIQPKAEAEVALILARDVLQCPGSRDELAASIACAVPAIEIVDSRIADWKISFADTIADNGSSGMFVLGAARRPLEGLDLWSCGMVLELNGCVASMGAGAACLGHPLDAACWLARTLLARNEPLLKGDIVLTGALGPMIEITPGDRVRATIGGLGSVAFGYGEPR